jgi:hypothetical protein
VGLGVSDHKMQEKLRIVSGSAAGRKLVSFKSPQTRPMMEKVSSCSTLYLSVAHCTLAWWMYRVQLHPCCMRHAAHMVVTAATAGYQRESWLHVCRQPVMGSSSVVWCGVVWCDISAHSCNL